MGLFNRNEGGIMDAIRCDESDYLIWKWKPEGQSVNSTKKENSIRWGSSLRVKDGEVAIFVYHQKSGATQDVFVGPYDEILSTKNLPVLTQLLGIAYNGNSPFQAEVYYINTANVIQIPFIIPYFNVYDPRFQDFACPVSARGRITFCIADYKQFIKLHRLTEFNLGQFTEQVSDGIKKHAKSFIGNAPMEYGFPVVQIERFIAELSEAMKASLLQEMLEDFGVTLKRVDLSSIDCDKESDEYRKLYKLTGKQKVKQVVFATDMGLIKDAVSGINKLRDDRKKQKINRDDMARKNRLATEQEFLVPHIIDSRVGGFLQKIGLGGKYANERVSSELKTAQVIGNHKSPSEFYISIDGKSKGPFAIQTLIEMKNASMISEDTYFWKKGMANWKKANEIPDLAFLFAPEMPPIPPAPPTK